MYQAHEPTTEIVNFCVCCVSVFPCGSICGGPRGAFSTLQTMGWCKRSHSFWNPESSTLLSYWAPQLRLPSVRAWDLQSQLEKMGWFSCVLLDMDLPGELIHQRRAVHPPLPSEYTLCWIYAPPLPTWNASPNPTEGRWQPSTHAQLHCIKVSFFLMSGMKRIINSADQDVLFSGWKRLRSWAKIFQAYFCSFLHT